MMLSEYTDRTIAALQAARLDAIPMIHDARNPGRDLDRHIDAMTDVRDLTATAADLLTFGIGE